MDVTQELATKLDAHSFVLKSLVQVVHQMLPQGQVGPALEQMLTVSIANASGGGEDAEALRSRVLAEALEIVRAGVSARPAT